MLAVQLKLVVAVTDGSWKLVGMVVVVVAADTRGLRFR